MRTTAILAASLLLTTGAFAQKHARQADAPGKVGIATRIIHPTEHRNWRGAERQELHATIWYPAVDTTKEIPQLVGPPDQPLFQAGSAAPNAEMEPALQKWPTILLSHGTGGSALQMAWLGTALARAGFLAIAVDHPGNNGNEPLTAEGFTLWWERATDLTEVLDGMLKDAEFGPRIEQSAIGVAGFSLGGYTAMELVGAQTDVSVLFDQCRRKPDTVVCHVPEMAHVTPPIKDLDDLLDRVRKSSGESLARSGESYRDPRIHAAFAIAPAIAEVFTPDSLHAIRVPVEMVVGDADPIAPAKNNTDYIRANLRGARETVLPGGVSHYTFLDTCTAAGKQRVDVYCRDAAGVDRDAVHTQVSGMAVQFFVRALKLK
jgi:predicted dienelactone hydrolase